MNSTLLVAALIAGPLVFTALVIPLIRRLAWGLNLVDHPAAGDHKSHQRPTPYGGGMAIFLVTLLSAVLLLLGALYLLVTGTQLAPGMTGQMSQISGLLGCASVLFLIGLIDDWRGLPALPRLLIEIAAAGVLVVHVPAFRFPFLGEQALGSVLPSVLWIVALTNAFNFLDNMDGLTGGMAAFALAGLGLMALHADHLPGAALSLVLIGALVGFLLYNFPPASVFMGDAGGLFLGFMVSGLSVLLSHSLSGPGFHPAHQFAPLLVLSVPLYDLVTVLGIRLRAGAPPWVGDNNHISHRLVRRGLPRREAVLVIYGATLLTGVPCLLTLWSHTWTGWLLLLLLPAAAGVVATLDLGDSSLAPDNRGHNPQ